jgi:hypothetical protein
LFKTPESWCAPREAHFHFMQNDNEVKQLARCGDKSQKEARTVTFGILGNSATILPVICLNYQRTANFQAYFNEILLLNTFCMPRYEI